MKSSGDAGRTRKEYPAQDHEGDRAARRRRGLSLPKACILIEGDGSKAVQDGTVVLIHLFM